MCDIVLLVYDQLAYTKGCVESILKNTDLPYKLLIIDNGSVKTETLHYLDNLGKSDPDRIAILRIDKNIGYVRAVNYGLAQTTQEYVCVISNDTVVYPGWLSELIATVKKDPVIGLVNPLWMVPKKFHGSHDKYYANIVRGQRGRYVETDWARGFCFLITRQVLDKIGGLDEAFAPAYFDDWDYSIRAIKAGFRCACALGAFVWHYKNVTYGLEFSNDSLRWKGKIFYRRWGAPIKILLLDDQNGSMPSRDFAGFIRELLNGQNRVTFVSTRIDHVFSDHTNMRYCRVPKFWFRPYILLRLLDNLRYHKLKRYDMIISSKKMRDSLQAVSVIRNSYPQRFYAYDGKFSSLQAEVASLKQQKAQGFL